MTTPIRRNGARALRSGRPLHRKTATPVTLQIVTTSLGGAQENQAIAAPGLLVEAINGTGPYTWSLIGAPSWLTINGTGLQARLLGTPTVDGEFTFDVRVVDSLARQHQRTFVLIVANQPDVLNITTTSFTGLRQGTAIPSPGLAIEAAGGSGPFLWEKVSGPAWGTVSGTTRTARLNGTPSASGPVSFVFKVTDSLGQTDTQTVTATVNPPTPALDITTTSFGTMVVDVPIEAPGLAVVSANGTGPFTWSKVSGPAWATVSGTGQTGRVNGTPPSVVTNATITVRVVDSLGASAQETITFSVVEASVPGDPLYFRRIGLTKNQASDDQMELLYNEFKARRNGGQNRIVGGLVRYDLGGPNWGGSNVVEMKPAMETRMDRVLDDGGAYNAPIYGYTEAKDQRVLQFEGSILAPNLVGWNGGVGSNLQEQMGDPGRTINGNLHPPRVPSAANGYYRGPIGAGKLGGTGYYGTGDGGKGLSVHGPGIPYLHSHAGSTVAGQPKLNCVLPVGNARGAGCSFAGKPISGPGIAASTTVTGRGSGGFNLSKPAAGTASGFYKIGGEPFLCIGQEGGLQFEENQFVVGQSGTYYIGGTNAGQDTKMWYDDPRDFERLAANITSAGNHTRMRIKRAESWNEAWWAMGGRPTVDIARMARMMWHFYVGVKKRDPRVTVCSASPGAIVESRANFLNAPDATEALLNFWINVDPNYGVDLLAANGLTKTFASAVPADEWSIHPYTQNPTNPNDYAFGQCADVFNMIGAATGGDYLPLAPTEQGVEWTRASTGGVGTDPCGTAAAYTAMKRYIDVFHGLIPWPNVKRLNGPGAKAHLPTGSVTNSTTITLADRMAAMALVFSCPTMFASREPSQNNLGIGWDKNNNQKYYPGGGTNDPMKALAEA